jgi:hypothetical protein
MLGRTRRSFSGLLYSLRKGDFSGVMDDAKDLLFYNAYYAILSTYKSISSVLYWGWNMRNSVDYDAHSMYDLMYLKLDRIYKEMVNNSHLMWNSKETTKGMKRLAETRRLAKMLANDTYNCYVYKVMDKYTCPNHLKPSSIFNKIRINGEKEKKLISDKLYSLYFKKASELDRLNYLTIKNRYFMLLGKHIEGWWD